VEICGVCLNKQLYGLGRCFPLWLRFLVDTFGTRRGDVVDTGLQ
jgi:hypothetical protein